MTARTVAVVARTLWCAAVGAVVGCADSATGSGADTAVVDISDSGGADGFTDGGPDDGFTPGPTCAGNEDCAGGELCRDGVCREACRTDADCEGALSVCDTTTGICVGCVSDAECAVDERCLASQCTFACGTDGACGDGQTCDRDTGECTDRECETAEECREGSDCVEGQCVAAEPVICAPGTSRCADGTEAVLLCSGDGTREAEQPCNDGEVCEQDGDAASCVRFSCTPDEVFCVDDNTAALCDAAGTGVTELPCRPDQYCELGVCQARECEPSTTVCDGDDLVVCDSLGAQATTTPCDESGACASAEFGCRCRSGACEERVCAAGTSTCIGDSVRTCNATGSAFLDLQACDADASCMAGVCVDDVCVANTEECAGNSLLQCNDDGTERTVTDCTRTGQVCLTTETGPGCITLACVPNAVRCAGERLGICTADGLTERFTDCAATSGYCDAGARSCAPQVCTPGAVFCSEGDVYSCNARGSIASRTGVCSTRLGCDEGACVEGCGDLIVQDGEDCDDGNRSELDDCRNNCTFTDAGALGQPCDTNGECGSGQWCSTIAGYRRCAPVALADTAQPMRFVYVPGGTFQMGSEVEGENPVHSVTLQPFFMATTAVTAGQWAPFGVDNPSFFDRDQTPRCTDSTCPVEMVNWWEAAFYANLLSIREGLESCYVLGSTTGTFGSGCAGTSCSNGTFVASAISFAGRDCGGYRLPSEAEREFAARGGTTSTYHWGESTVGTVMARFSWYAATAGSRTRPVAQLEPNAFGLYDTAGNLYEWVWDFVVTYSSAEQFDPFGPTSGTYRGARGGLWSTDPVYVRPAYRFYSIPANRSNAVGFRLVRSLR